jgi:16S rRNA (adenine1518-N6/adenine1519-N6)-dimethyltransferase
VEVIEGDALKIDLGALLSPGGRIVGNLPYAISSPLLRRFLDLRDRATDLNVLLQKEVADRMAATAGSKDYGILSVLYGIWASTSIPLRFGPGCFEPPPRVDSALFGARFRARPDSPVPPFAVLEPLLKSAFAQRRKTLENNLRGRYPNLKQHLRLLNIVGSRRAETLSIDEFVRLGLAIASEKGAHVT